VVWRRLDEPGADHCTLTPDGAGWRLEGTAVAALAGQPVRAAYAVTCDEGWRTRRVLVSVADGLGKRALRLDVDAHGRWWRNGVEQPALAGLLDVDIGITPATNTLPIRRLALPVGAGHDVTAAWVRVPDLVIEPLPQRYTRLDTRRHRYESDEGRFVAELEVDDLGLVVHYDNGWERVASIG
jgi:hypothetical protein